jgi:3-phosphoshikimate 1-carboxyvinyltransferase
MQAVIQPSRLSGVVSAPASKSAMQRACAAALLKGGETVLSNPGVSDDDKAAIGIVEQLGARVEEKNENIIITSQGGVRPVSDGINCGESGLSVRMFTSIAALANKPITITGKGSLLKRPLSFFNEVLPSLGVQCESNSGLLPLKIQGPLKPSNILVDGSLSSQFLTGLLFAYSGADASDVTITVKNLNSKPYIDLTLKVMEDFGLKIPENNTYGEFYFPRRSTAEFNHASFNYTVESDWSGGAFLLVAAAISGNIAVKGLDIFSTQADKAIIQALRQSGVQVNITERHIEIEESRLQAFDFDATDCPDLFPPLVALASYCDGTSVIEGVHRLSHKESNRALTLQDEFGKMGVGISFQGDTMLVEGGKGVKSAAVSSRHDHRIAMACAVAALKANGEVSIDDAEAVNKSYPQFWQHLQKLNAGLSLNHK